MDTTTNWAIGATAALISFALGAAEIPHYRVPRIFPDLISFWRDAVLSFYHLSGSSASSCSSNTSSSRAASPRKDPGRDHGRPDGAPSGGSIRHLGRTVPTCRSAMDIAPIAARLRLPLPRAGFRLRAQADDTRQPPPRPDVARTRGDRPDPGRWCPDARDRDAPLRCAARRPSAGARGPGTRPRSRPARGSPRARTVRPNARTSSRKNPDSRRRKVTAARGLGPVRRCRCTASPPRRGVCSIAGVAAVADRTSTRPFQGSAA